MGVISDCVVEQHGLKYECWDVCLWWAVIFHSIRAGGTLHAAVADSNVTAVRLIIQNRGRDTPVVSVSGPFKVSPRTVCLCKCAENEHLPRCRCEGLGGGSGGGGGFRCGFVDMMTHRHCPLLHIWPGGHDPLATGHLKQKRAQVTHHDLNSVRYKNSPWWVFTIWMFIC